MKICLIGPHFPVMSYPCGAADFIEGLAKNLSQENIDVTVITSNCNARKSDVFNVKVFQGNWGVLHVLRIFQWLCKNSVSVIDIQYEAYMYEGRWAIFLLPILCRLFLKNTMIVLTLHSQYLPEFGSRFWRPIQISFCHKVVFYSEIFKKNMEKYKFPNRDKFFVQGFPSNIVKHASNLVNLFIDKLKNKNLTEQKMGVYFGHLNEGRGIEDIINSLAIVKEKKIPFSFVFLGQFNPESNIYHRNLISLIKSLNLNSEISFSDRLSDDNISILFQSADFCVLPFIDGASFKNGSLAAAIIHNVPTISTISEITEIELANSKAILWYKSGNIENLADNLKKLLIDQNLLISMRSEMNKLEQFYSWQKYTSERIKIYNKPI